MPKAVVYGPLEYGGVAFPEVMSLQDGTQLPYLLKELRWDKSVANAMLTTIDQLQMRVGFVRPIMEFTTLPIRYASMKGEFDGYFLSLRQRLADIDGSLWLEDAWTPTLQREGDASIMKRLVESKLFSPSVLSRANNARLYLRVITIADLASEKGHYIPDGRFTFRWHIPGWLRFTLSRHPMPTPERPRPAEQCIQRTFCIFAPPYQRLAYSMPLDTPLGKWHRTRRNYDCYRSRDKLFFRTIEGELREHRQRTPGTGVYHFHETVSTLPDDAHPIPHRQVGSAIWSQRPHDLSLTTNPAVPPPGHLLGNTITDPTRETITIAGDGSVHVKEQVSAAAWLVTSGEPGTVFEEEETAMATVLVEDVERANNVFRGLAHIQYLGLMPKEVAQWCDNEQVFKDRETPLDTLKKMLHADADMILATHHLRNRADFHVTLRHVYGHQDTKSIEERKAKRKEKRAKRDTKRRILFASLEEHELYDNATDSSPSDTDSDSNATDPGEASVHSLIDGCTQQPRTLNPYATIQRRKQLSKEAKMNVACDKVASETTRLRLEQDEMPPLPELLCPPLPGQKAMLKLGSRHVTSKHKSTIYKARRTEPMRIYMRKKYGWTDEEIDSINELSRIGRVRRRMTHTRQRQTSKIMHGWLPTMHMRRHITGISQCPGCSHADETIEHLLRCPHPLMARKRKEVLLQLQKKGLEARIPRMIVRALCDVTRKYFDSDDDFHVSHMTEIREAIRQQEALGMRYMLRGFLVKGWEAAIAATGANHPDRLADAMQQLIGDEIIDPMWATRNDILHRQQNNFDAVEQEQMAECNGEVLSSYDQSLARFDEGTIHRLSRRTRREWLRQLDNAKAAYERDRRTMARPQQRITRYFQHQQPHPQPTTPNNDA
ncbi:LOW QUALITY PROTEIN: hypothetical protein ACHAXT_004791 [Thalassiosira profunda]